MNNPNYSSGGQVNFEAKILFPSIDSVNDQILGLKRELKNKFDQILVHYDLSDEVSDLGVKCIGIRIEFFRYVQAVTMREEREAWSEAAKIINKYKTFGFEIIR